LAIFWEWYLIMTPQARATHTQAKLEYILKHKFGLYDSHVLWYRLLQYLFFLTGPIFYPGRQRITFPNLPFG
jgi:hypothetical protein